MFLVTPRGTHEPCSPVDLGIHKSECLVGTSRGTVKAEPHPVDNMSERDPVWLEGMGSVSAWCCSLLSPRYQIPESTHLKERLLWLMLLDHGGLGLRQGQVSHQRV